MRSRNLGSRLFPWRLETCLGQLQTLIIYLSLSPSQFVLHSARDVPDDATATDVEVPAVENFGLAGMETVKLDVQAHRLEVLETLIVSSIPGEHLHQATSSQGTSDTQRRDGRRCTPRDHDGRHREAFCVTARWVNQSMKVNANMTLVFMPIFDSHFTIL